jgi:bacterioferritin (cytochrome b1)
MTITQQLNTEKMIELIAFLLSFFALCAQAMPMQASASDIKNDVGILQFALILENLELNFYRLGAKMFKSEDFSGFPLPSSVIFENFKAIASHELTHVESLNATILALGSQPLPACDVYEFGLTDVKTFVATARVLERVGTSAYAGAVSMLKESSLVTVGTSIAEIEARHASFLNTINQLSPFPASFETPLSMKAVITLATPILKSCPFTIPVKPFPELILGAKTTVVGDTLFFKETSDAKYCAFINGLMPIYSQVDSSKSCKVPYGLSGDVFVFLTSDATADLASDSSVIAGPASILIMQETLYY